MLRKDPAALELLQTRGENVRAEAGEARGEIRVALRAVEQLTHDQERPALPDQPEGMGNGAVLLVALAHVPSVAPGLAVVKDLLAKNKLPLVG